MQRAIVYSGSIPLETDILKTNQYAMVGLAKLAAAMLGTSTVVNGLTAVPTGPASLSINVNPGEIYSLVSLEATAYSSLPQDTAHTILKQGVLLDAVNLSCPAPGSAGQSVNYLIQAIFQEADTTLVALPYYNASNPTQAWSGPNNSGTPQATIRSGTVVLSAKAGAAAATGSQTTPTPDAGYTGLWVVTVANGQTQILAGNITQYAGAPILPSSLLASIQNGNLSYAVATGTANAHVVALTPALTQRVDGMVIRYKAPAANTGALTLNDGLGAVSVVGGAHAALQGGETTTNGDVWVQWNSSVGGGSYIMLDSSGGALQVAPATKSQHALQAGQALGLFLGVQVFTSSGTYTPGSYNVGGRTVTPTTAIIEGIGGGGGGGGAPATNSSQVSVGTGGNSGAKGKILWSNPTSQTVTIGAAGVGGSSAGGTGGTGGNSSVGAIAVFPGGTGGPGGVAGVPPTVNNNTGSVTTVSGSGTILEQGSSILGSYGFALSTGVTIGGRGGDPGNGWGTANPGGSATGIGVGVGGSGGNQGISGPGIAGGAGTLGKILIYEYA